MTKGFQTIWFKTWLSTWIGARTLKAESLHEANPAAPGGTTSCQLGQSMGPLATTMPAPWKIPVMSDETFYDKFFTSYILQTLR